MGTLARLEKRQEELMCTVEPSTPRMILQLETKGAKYIENSTAGQEKGTAIKETNGSNELNKIDSQREGE